METITFSDGTKYTLSDTTFSIKKNKLDVLFAKFHARFAKKHKIVNYTNHMYYWKFPNYQSFRCNNIDEYKSLINNNQDLKDNQLVKNWFFGILVFTQPIVKLELLGKVHPLHVKLDNCTPDNFCSITEEEFLQVLKKNYPIKWSVTTLEHVFTYDNILTFCKGKYSNEIIELLIKNNYQNIKKIIEEIKPKISIKFLEKFYSKKSYETHHILFNYLTPGQKEEFAPKINPINLELIDVENFKYFINKIDELKWWEFIQFNSDKLQEVLKLKDITNIPPWYLEKLKKKVNIAVLSDALYPWND